MREKIGRKGIAKRLFSVVLALAMVLTLVVNMPMEVKADVGETVSYIDASGTEQTVTITKVTSGGYQDELSSGWYIIRGNIEMTSNTTIADGVNLILADNSNLYINGTLELGGSLNIWAQSQGANAGKMKVVNGSGDCPITLTVGQSITVNGGSIQIDSYDDGVSMESSDSFTVNGGTVTITTDSRSSAAMNTAPTLGSGIEVITASTNVDGSSPVETYSASDIATYKYLKIGKPHTHTDHYGVTTTTTANDTLTWYCGAGCPSGAVDAAHAVKLTLSASSANYSGNSVTIGDSTETSKDIKITGYEAWKTAVGSYPIVEFSNDNGATWSTDAPSSGNHKVRVYPAAEVGNPTHYVVEDLTFVYPIQVHKMSGDNEVSAVAGVDYEWLGSDLSIKADNLILSGGSSSNILLNHLILDENVSSITFNGLYIVPHDFGLVVYSDFQLTLKGENQIGTSDRAYDRGITLMSGCSGINITGDGNLTIYDKKDGIYSEYNASVTFDSNFTGALTIDDAGDNVAPPAPPCAISIGSGTLAVNNGTLNLKSDKQNGITAGEININGGTVIAQGDTQAMSVEPTLGSGVKVEKASKNFDGSSPEETYDSSDINSYKYLKIAKTHTWTYSANGATLTATCNKGCGASTAHTATLTLTASSANYSGSDVTPTITFTQGPETSSWTTAGLNVPGTGNYSMVYYAANASGQKTGSALSEISAIGKYVVEVTIAANAIAEGSSSVTVSVPFEITEFIGAIFNNGGTPITLTWDDLVAGKDKGTLGYGTSGTITATSIGESAFSDCSKLTSITIPDGVTSIGESAFSDCSNLTSITIPDGVTSISNNLFHNCSKLESITIPNTVTSIGRYAFSDCSNLTSITIPDGVTSIGISAFYECSKLANITIPSSVTSIGSAAFWGCAMTNITIPNNITAIEISAFRECNKLTSITIPSGVTTIGGSAFRDCTSLTSVTFLGTVGTDGSGMGDSETIFENVGTSGKDKTTLYLPATGLTGPENNETAWHGGYFKTVYAPSKPAPSKKHAEPTKSPVEEREADEAIKVVLPVSIDATQFAKVNSTVIPATAYNLSNLITTKGIVRGINTAIAASKLTGSKAVIIYTGKPFCFNREIIKAIQNGNKTVVYYFVHEGHLYSVTIPATVDATKVLERSGFAGPLYVGQQLGTTRLIR